MIEKIETLLLSKARLVYQSIVRVLDKLQHKLPIDRAVRGIVSPINKDDKSSTKNIVHIYSTMSIVLKNV